MLDDLPCPEVGLHSYHETMTAIRRADEALYNYVAAKVPHKQWHELVHELRFEKRALYDRLEAVVKAMLARNAFTAAGEPAVPMAWEIAQEIARTYRCGVGFADLPQVRTVIVRLKHQEVVVGLPKEIIKASNQVAKDFESNRKWTFGWDNRMFIMDLPLDAIRELEKHPDEDEPSFRIQMANCIPPYNPNVENLDWGVERILAAVPWGLNPPLIGAGVNIAVVDTGIKNDHPDFWKDGVCVYKGGYNFVGGNSNPADDHDHGTYCCGIAAAQHNGSGYKGVAPGVNLYAVKVLDSKGSGSYANIAAGVDWCRTHGMHIVSMSLGGPSSAAVLQQACDAAWYAGLLLVAAAGNEGPNDNTVGYPAKYQSVMAVAAINYLEEVASFSSRGPEVEIAAPGVSITGPFAGNTYHQYATDDKKYMCASGTSAACPHVAPAAAIVKQWYPFITNSDLRKWLRDHARDI
jgi:subtilisin